MTSPHGHVQPDEYVSSSPYSQFVLNDYETPVDRILLSDNPSSSNTPSAPQHTQGVGTLQGYPILHSLPPLLHFTVMNLKDSLSKPLIINLL
ncbi:hypothetical protein NC653_018806 [Populus alba x Populus x berolinensis]|uniref:Uncharacterized protein n=1 Tax=Populus alba x Populus x berolinensis TaxID=444605 RepID=A0AAD6QH91_9ROSI|nr:hypothetical protein NC653_018806 [Populus alba x Populus x berolinensis]